MGQMPQGPNGTGLSPHVAHMRPHHRSMARAVALGNRRPKDLMVEFGMSAGQISRIMGSPAFQAEVRRIEEDLDLVSIDIARDLKVMTERAFQVLDEDISADSTCSMEMRRLRNNAALEVLGMAGIRRTGGNQTNININSNNKVVKAVEDLDLGDIRNEIVSLTLDDEGSYS